MTFCVAILFLIFGSCGSGLAQSQPPVDLTGKNVLVFHSFEGNAPIFLGTDKDHENPDQSDLRVATSLTEGECKMLWNRQYIIKSYVRSSLWLMPFFAVLAYMVVTRITHGIGGWLLHTGRIDETAAFLGLSMAGARTMLETIVTINLSFLVFTFGSLLVAIQVAGGQYTPRIIATTLLRDNAIRFTVGYFVFTLLFTLRVLTRMGDETVHQFNTFLAAMLGLVSLVVFLYLIDYAARLLRPVSIVQRVGKSGIAVIQSVYPESTASLAPCRVVRQTRSAGPDSRQRGHLGDRARRGSEGTGRASAARQRDD